MSDKLINETASVTPFLTFNGNARKALNFYASVFPDAKVVRCQNYGEVMPEMVGDGADRVMHGELDIRGSQIFALDMDAAHPAPEFYWSSSLMFTCESEAEFDAVFAGLAQGGSVMMGPESVGLIRKCAWVVDKFGVVWQPVWQ
jgi:predicted 3-demethylubiquinone-9 3-methyltransferase (glyoxalase superfamily)